jgi:uncharacterized protein (DUF58 family)
VNDANGLFVDYRVRWKAHGLRPGAFRGVESGAGDHIRASLPLRGNADPRRLDLRATMRDPFGTIWIREFEQNAALKVAVLADVSASMGFVGRHDKIEEMRRVAVAIAQAAWRNGDAFGFFGANESPRAALTLPVRVNRGAAAWVARQLAASAPEGRSARGLARVVPLLPRRRALVFVVSDFLWPERDVSDLLRRLAHHAVVPVVLRDPAETDAIHRRGIAMLRDLETGERRFVWLRPGLVDALRARRAERDARLRELCRVAGCAPFFVRGRFEAAALTRYFMEMPA